MTDNLIFTHRKHQLSATPQLYRSYVSLRIVAIAFVNAAEVSKCYSVNNERHCFYTSDTSASVLRWNEAREFCMRRNSTLPIITDEKTDNVFQRFIDDDSYNIVQNSYVWLDAHRVNDDVKWQWINGQSSGTDDIVVIVLTRLTCVTNFTYSIVKLRGYVPVTICGSLFVRASVNMINTQALK